MIVDEQAVIGEYIVKAGRDLENRLEKAEMRHCQTNRLVGRGGEWAAMNRSLFRCFNSSPDVI